MHQGEVSKQRARSPRYAGFAPLGPSLAKVQQAARWNRPPAARKSDRKLPGQSSFFKKSIHSFCEGDLINGVATNVKLENLNSDVLYEIRTNTFFLIGFRFG